MADDELIAQFSSITSAPAARAEGYLRLTDNNLEQAIQLYFESDGGLDLSGGDGTAPQASGETRTEPSGAVEHPIPIDSDDEHEPYSGSHLPPAAQHSTEDDEAVARRLQEEMYGGEMVGDPESLRAPVARTAETLLGPTDWRNNPDQMSQAIADQMMARSARHTGARPGIFNQRPIPNSIWDSENSEEARRESLSRATAGASDSNSKLSQLAEMYRPPTEIISPYAWDILRQMGREQMKWILVDVQDSSVFDCQILNRDIWKNPEIQATVKEHFLFKQYLKDDPTGQSYINYYFSAHESQDAYPHIAIVDPRTGEQVKVWSGAPCPKPMEFLMQLHEFLDRYSLKSNARNPVAKRKPELRKEFDVNKLTEEEALELALQNSLGAQLGPRPADPDDLTRSIELGKARAEPATSETAMDIDEPVSNGGAHNGESASLPSVFSTISSSNPHVEPPADPATTTRIQFKHAGGREIRRFYLQDPVRRIFEWLKAEPLEGKQGEFELISLGKNLIEKLDLSIEEAALKNGTVHIEFIEG